MQEIRVGIIGCGVISHRHMLIYSHLPQFKIVAGCEIDPAKAKAWQEKYGEDIAMYSDYRELLARDDIDAVDVCVHNNLHAPISLAVMKAGKACYCEKPLTASYADSKLLNDAADKLGVKFAVQISSIMNAQTRIARDMIAGGQLGSIYHARSAYGAYRRRPGLDMALSQDFFSKEIAGHGPMCDLGVYHVSQMLYIMGMPELESVYGMAYSDKIERAAAVLGDKIYGVEDQAVGMAKFKGGLGMEITETWASNMENIGPSYVNGTKGALVLDRIDSFGGEYAVPESRKVNGQLPEQFQCKLKYIGLNDAGLHVETDLKAYYNQQQEKLRDPGSMIYNCNHCHWYAYLTGQLTDETRYHTPKIALATALLTEGIFLSSELGRSVTADEIRAMSKSTALWKQETPWGTFDHDSTY